MGTEEWKVLLPLWSVKVQNYWCKALYKARWHKLRLLQKQHFRAMAPSDPSNRVHLAERLGV